MRKKENHVFNLNSFGKIFEFEFSRSISITKRKKYELEEGKGTSSNLIHHCSIPNNVNIQIL